MHCTLLLDCRATSAGVGKDGLTQNLLKQRRPIFSTISSDADVHVWPELMFKQWVAPQRVDRVAPCSFKHCLPQAREEGPLGAGPV